MVPLHVLYLQKFLSISPFLVLFSLPLSSILRSTHLTSQPRKLFIKFYLTGLLLVQYLIESNPHNI